MLSLLLRTGGRPFAYDDIEILQTLALAGTRLFAGLPNCVVSGCQLTPSGSSFDVGGGVLWLDGELCDFPGRADVTLPALFQLGAEVRSDNRVHTLTSQNLPCAREQNAELVDYDPLSPPSRRPLMLTANGPLMWWHRVQEKTHSAGKIEWLSTYTAADYTNGVGVGAAWGWALCDGIGGRIDLNQKFVVGHSISNAAYAAGASGGASTVALGVQHLPAHHHGLGSVRFGQSNAGQNGNIVRTDSRNDGALSGNTQDTGGGQEFSIVPPYVALVARQWVGFD